MKLRLPAIFLVLSLCAGATVAQSAAVQVGASVYTTHCLGCHAATPGNIGTMVLAKRLGKESSVLADRKDLHPGFVAAIVRHGLGIMPGFRPTEISDAEIDQLTAYLSGKH
jgi:mono/diheme cytochrome c family protein